MTLKRKPTKISIPQMKLIKIFSFRILIFLLKIAAIKIALTPNLNRQIRLEGELDCCAQGMNTKPIPQNTAMETTSIV